ncbi:MAG: DUF4276 family protein [Deltaproteobacteria bacterium]|jgi:hypothetical protein|nr:DUF4276 family protein [Deltaproteobacteria bacterium]
MVACKVFIEGGGDYRALHLDCRQGFSEFFLKAGIPAHLPILPIACGGRKQAYQDFCKAIRNRENALLLVDSEEVINTSHGDKPWQHLARRQGDEWQQPSHTTEDDCHLMVTCMESWFLTDIDTLATFFGDGFNPPKISDTQHIESVPKAEVFSILAQATVCCKEKGQYGKGRHSFKILADIDPNKVAAHSPWAKRFIDELKRRAIALSQTASAI